MEKRWTKKSENEKNFKKNEKNFDFCRTESPYAEKEQIWTSELRKLCLTAKNENTFKHHHEEREEHFYRTNTRDR